jgi:beta-galactosidase GanA
VTAQRRTNEGHEYLFLQNFSGVLQSVPLPSTCFDFLKQREVASALDFEPWGSTVLRRART